MHHNHSIEQRSTRDHKVLTQSKAATLGADDTAYRKQHMDRSLLQQILQVSIFAGLLLIALQSMFGSSHAFASESGVSERNSSGVLMLGDGTDSRTAILLDARMELSVQGLLADMTLEQTFRNTTGQWLEGQYLFPLPEDAAVRGLTITVGDRVIKGQIMPRQLAKQHYTAAKDAGQIASLVEQNRPNLFTMSVASIAPNDDIKIKLDVMLPVTLEDQTLQLVLPTTLTPRYTNELTPDAAVLDIPFARQTDIRGPRLTLVANIAPLDDLSIVSSSTHTLDTSSGVITLTDIPMDRDIVLSWPMRDLPATSGEAFTSKHNDKRYMQVLLSPPSDASQLPSTSRELIMLIDKSGSMAGESIRAARETIHFALDGLDPDDTFNIIAFDDGTQSLFSSARPAEAGAIATARRFADQLDADGGTEMLNALQLALNGDRDGRLMQINRVNADTEADTATTKAKFSADYRDQPRLKQLVFLTDGSVGYEDSLLKFIKRRLGNSRLFTVGIGSAPNTWFLEKAAEAGRGVSLSIRDTSDVASAVSKLLSRLEQPVITDLSIQYANGFGEIYPSPIPDLYAGRPTMILGRISDHVDEIILTGRRAGERWTQTISIPASAESGSSHASSLAMQWARAKVENLLDEQRDSIDNERHKDAITALAIEVGLVTPYTSFVAFEAEPVRPKLVPGKSVKVASLVPHGNDMRILHLPQGAAGSDLLALLSFVFALCGFGFLYIGVRPTPTGKS